ncbi:MAG TPA: hypothetical protein VGJ62_01960 [Gemmatimonadaceae bacterium]
MKTRYWIAMILLPLAMTATATIADGQGKGQGKGQGPEKAGQGQDRGGEKAGKGPVANPSRGASASQQQGTPQNAGQMRAAEVSRGGGPGRSAEHVPGNAGHTTLPASANASPRANVAAAPNRGRVVSRFERDLHVSEVRPVVRTFVVSSRPSEFVTGGAVAYALARGAPDNALLIVPASNQVLLRNRKGDVLVALDDDHARTLGAWDVFPANDRVNAGAPSFCRSGAGHPVWGRQWCLDKGFGLGSTPNVRWGTTRDISDIVFGRRVSSGTLTRDVLLNLLGPVAFDRLALHAVTLGYTDPLTGVWHSEATGPDVLFVNSGNWPIAEFVDTNRDQRPELMLVALRPW